VFVAIAENENFVDEVGIVDEVAVVKLSMLLCFGVSPLKAKE
jgi:hypothetical protein